MAAIGYVTKMDLSGIGSMATMALLGVIIISVANALFLKNTGLELMMDYIVVFLFVGDQSLLRSWHRWREIVHLEEQRDMYRQGAEKAQQEMLLLQNPDSLEQYAREHYYMHTPNEDIFLVEDD